MSGTTGEGISMRIGQMRRRPISYPLEVVLTMSNRGQRSPQPNPGPTYLTNGLSFIQPHSLLDPFLASLLPRVDPYLSSLLPGIDA